jgi:hypothetical protein
MQSPDLLQRFIFIIPLVLLPALLIFVRFPWRMALFVWITGTLIQVAALFIASLPPQELPRVILTFYPFALFPLGLWSVILGLAGWALAIRLRWPLALDKPRRLCLPAICGGVVGLAFAFLCAHLLQMIGSAPAPRGPTVTQLWVRWELGGFCAGAADGAIIAFFLPRDHEPLFRWAGPNQTGRSTDRPTTSQGGSAERAK